VAWSQRLARKTVGPNGSALARALVKRQQWLYFPLLLFARLIWAFQSFAFAFKLDAFYWDVKSSAVTGSHAKLPPVVAHLTLQRLALIVHYAWYIGFMLRYMTVPGAFVFFLTSQCLSGLLIAIVFGVGHNAMTIYDADKKPGFAEHQVTTTRNIDDGPFTSWFMGGLQYQIEHHLFPTMPRHSLPAIRKMVEPLCARYGIPYRSTSLWRGTVEVLEHLAQVSTDLLKHGPQ
jgi:acyl-lipid Delta6-acetylenase / acyl-lipid (9-3)-desaturase